MSDLKMRPNELNKIKKIFDVISSKNNNYGITINLNRWKDMRPITGKASEAMIELKKARDGFENAQIKIENYFKQFKSAEDITPEESYNLYYMFGYMCEQYEGIINSEYFYETFRKCKQGLDLGYEDSKNMHDQDRFNALNLLEEGIYTYLAFIENKAVHTSDIPDHSMDDKEQVDSIVSNIQNKIKEWINKKDRNG